MGRKGGKRGGGALPLRRAGDFQFSRVFISMQNSPAWLKLTGAQMRLYLRCQLWTYEAGARKEPNPQKFPRDRWTDGGNIRENDFYIDFGRVKACQLFNESNKTTFVRAKKQLIELGFIDCVVDGNKTGGRERSVFRLSERWKMYTENSNK